MEWIVGIMLAAVAGVLSPVLSDTLACVYIWCMNKSKGRPTWKGGTAFRTLTWPCGFTIYSGSIVNVTFSHVYFYGKLSGSDTVGATYAVKKSGMKKMIMGSY